MGFGKLILAWALSMPVFVGLVFLGRLVSGQANGSFIEALLGLGVLLLVPSLLFALIVGWPTMALLTEMRPAWIIPLAAGAALAMLMWLLTLIFLRNGWAGFEITLAAYAAVLGVIMGAVVTLSARGT